MVVAGFVLGWLAWKTKSIWGGVCVHCAVASTIGFAGAGAQRAIAVATLIGNWRRGAESNRR
ncbi:MAG: type II CAAX prenyl endopeptidase Rce1 family protein [Candidatus Acidiferrales bacterium]